MATPTYPSWNDKEYDLLKKMTSNTALIADYEIGDVASVAGTAGNVLVNGGTAAATGSITLSLPTALTSVNSVTAATTTNLTLSGGSSGASLVLGQGANGAATITPKGTGKLIVTGTAPKLSIENGAFSDGSTIFASNNGDATLTLQNAAVATKAIFGTSSSGTTEIGRAHV